MKRLIYTVTLLVFAISTFAAQVTGKVVDANTRKVIDFANVSIMQGDQLITGVVSDADGSFAIEVKDGARNVYWNKSFHDGNRCYKRCKMRYS